jgi:hypothetical protein
MIESLKEVIQKEAVMTSKLQTQISELNSQIFEQNHQI